ncbi:alpha/beta fold hydrolase [bacterium SCSIO 12643]|nr:alpha/beta fold hydrolase [bacterium SCSIO 12643]
MNNTLQFITIQKFENHRQQTFENIKLSYQVFGAQLHSAPIILVHHALTGNSNVANPDDGWWKDLIGKNKVINTDHYTVIAFNIYGNGYDHALQTDHTSFNAFDIAALQFLAMTQMEITQLYAAIGGSIGGGIAWEMAVAHPEFIQHLIPIASAWKSSDWIVGQTSVQESILQHSSKPLEDARMMAMLFYRTPVSFDSKFNHKKTNQNIPVVSDWLQFHGKSLAKRFQVQAYRTMNYILSTIDISKQKDSIEAALKPLQSHVIQIAIDTDIYFHKDTNLNTKKILDQFDVTNSYHEIQSVHGHDAFLIEYDQLSQILKPYFSIS